MASQRRAATMSQSACWIAHSRLARREQGTFPFPNSVSAVGRALSRSTRTLRVSPWVLPAAWDSLGIVIQVRRQPALGLHEFDALAPRVIGGLFLRYAADHEVLALWMAEVVAGDRGGRVHREAL